ERVAVLGENDQLSPLAGLVEHLRLAVLEELGETRPLGIGTCASYLGRELFEAAESDDLRLELGDRLRRGRVVDDLLLKVLELTVGEIVGVLRRIETFGEVELSLAATAAEPLLVEA